MKMQNATHNALNIRGLKELPPPICKLFRNGITADNTTSFRKKNTTPALLHQASASCGRVLCVLFLALFAFVFVACEKDGSTDSSVHTQMQSFYAESQGLMETSADSVVNYYKKFAGFHNQHPECEADELFPPTVVNLENALDHYGVIQIGDVIIHSEWGGERHLNF